MKGNVISALKSLCYNVFKYHLSLTNVNRDGMDNVSGIVYRTNDHNTRQDDVEGASGKQY